MIDWLIDWLAFKTTRIKCSSLITSVQMKMILILHFPFRFEWTNWSKPSYKIQWNLFNPTHQGIREICRIVQDVGLLRFLFSKQKYFGTINFCWMSQDVGKLRCRIAQVPLYRQTTRYNNCLTSLNVWYHFHCHQQWVKLYNVQTI